MKYTDYLGLKLPEETDPVSIGDISENFKKIAEQMPNTLAVPSGGIIIWSGAADAVPAGWALCDGENGTPDLRGRFVLGSSDDYEEGSTGGEATHKLTFSELPAHSHSIGSQSSGGSYNGIYGGKITNSSILVSTTMSGGSEAHNNMPPYYALCYIMKL